MRSKVTYIFLFIFIGCSFPVAAQQKVSLNGLVRDGQTKEGLGFATIQLNTIHGTSYGVITDTHGHYHLPGIPTGNYTATVSYLGYDKSVKILILTKNTTLSFDLMSSSTSLNEVIVTASESKGATSASKIDRTAMAYLQPTSFTDLLELLPGGKSSDPSMGKSNLIRLREAGSTNEQIASSGVSFMIDGTPLNADGNLQYIPGTLTNTEAKESVSKGIDMRTISTDNIESVEIIRGIPSVEYGNLTGGLVLIKRKRTASPFGARFKTDQFSKLFSVGKGLNLGGNHHILNMDLSYLDSKVDPRNSFENYKRITASIRWNAGKQLESSVMEWNLASDYTGSFDNVKQDKDNTVKENRYESTYDKFTVSGEWSLKFLEHSLLRTLRANVSLSQEFNRMDETRSISIDRPMAIPNSIEQGEKDGIYLPYNYVANMVVDGKPLYANAKFAGDFIFRLSNTSHVLKTGLEWGYSKNSGNGQVYDVTRPLSTASTIRPRSYKNIPAGETFSFFAEEQMKWSVGQHGLNLSAGLRGTSLLNLSGQYAMKGHVYLDPRFNLQWQLPAFGSHHDWFVDVSAGIGWLSKMPTIAQLYPDDMYIDIVQLNYYSTNPDFRRVNLMTYKWDNANYELEPARNRKWEIRLGLSHCGNNFSVTYFEERMNNAFRDVSYYRTLDYKKYDVSSINPSTLTGPPSLPDMNYTPEVLIDTYKKAGNGTLSHKQGVEFQFSSKRIEVLKTKITINGAWFRTTYSNSTPEYKSSSILLNGQQLQYIGLYDWEDGRTQEQFNTNFMFDTYLPKLGMIFSTSAQCTWFTSSQRLWNDGTPVSYIDKSGIARPFTSAEAEDIQLQHLVTKYATGTFDRTSIPFAMDINLKATKKIGKFMNVSLFVNRLLTVSPDYYSGTKLVRRNSSPYFGMEANVTF